MNTQTCWLEPTGQVAVGLRRYARADGAGWTCAGSIASATWHGFLVDGQLSAG